MSHLTRVSLPAFGMEEHLPAIRNEEYRQRIEAAVERMKQDRFDFLVIYADREHMANMAYLIGFEPRFEEALLLLDAQGRRRLLVGNECLGYLPAPELGCEVVLYQEFSLLGQPRDDSPPLREILADFGIRRGAAVGCVGWKYFEAQRMEKAAQAIEIPAYLVDLLRDLTGDWQLVRNATSIFMNPVDGLRTANSVDQIAQFEFAAIRTSESVRSAIASIKPGVVERDLEPLLVGAGLPLSCHRMVGFGEKARRGLASPSDNKARLGDPFTMAFGIWGSMTCRAGAVARGPEDLAPDVRDFCARYVANYFDVVVAWYESIRVGVTGGEVFAAAEARREPTLFDFAVNPGHLVHLDEWVHSPFVRGGQAVVRSGAALQMDIIPISRGPFCCANVEDALVIADEGLCAELAESYPACWQRIQARRRFMTDTLGIRLHPSVLPLSNTPAWLAPYALSPELALVAD